MKKIINQFFILFLSIVFMVNYSTFSANAEEIKTTKKLAIVGFSGILTKYEYSNNNKYQKNEEIDLTDSLTDKLVQYKSIGVLERGRLKAAINELGFTQSGLTDKSKEFGKFVGADYIAFGVITNVGQDSEIGVRVIDVETGIIVSSKSVKFNNERNNANLLDIVSYLSMEIAISLGEKIDANLLKDKRNLFENYSSNQNMWSIGALIGIGVLVGVIYFGRKILNI